MGDQGLIPGLRGAPGEGNYFPLQYSGLENSMGCIVHGVAQSWMQLSDFHMSLYILFFSSVIHKTGMKKIFFKIFISVLKIPVFSNIFVISTYWLYVKNSWVAMFSDYRRL